MFIYQRISVISLNENNAFFSLAMPNIAISVIKISKKVKFGKFRNVLFRFLLKKLIIKYHSQSQLTYILKYINNIVYYV